jgi:hypothetical protein
MKNFLLIAAVSCFLLFFSAEIKAQELVVNGNLESWDNSTTPAGWTLFENITQESGTIHGGTYSARHTSNTATKKFQQNLSGVIPGSSYTLSYWYYDNDATARTRIWCYWLSGGATLPDNETELRPATAYSVDDPNWIHVTYTLPAPPTADGFRFEVRVYKQDNVAGGSVFYDDFSFATGGAPLPEPTNYPTNFTAQANNLSIALGWADSQGGQLPQAYLIKASETDDIAAPVDGIFEEDDLDFTDGKGAKNITQGTQAYAFLNLDPGQQYFFRIYPYTNGGTNTNFKTDGTAPSASASTPDISVIISKDFTSQVFAPWDTISLANNPVNKRWGIGTYGGNSYAYINGYQATEPCNDWLISPSMNFNEYINETLTFRTATNFTGPALEVKISNDYVTGADPSTATWTPITATLSPGAYVWTSSGNIDVSGITGDNVHLAFRYITATDAAAWEVDDIAITGLSSVGVPEKSSESRNFTISPNPASGKCSLKFSQDGTKEIRVISVIGSTVLETSTDQAGYSLDLNALSPGIYFVQVYLPASKTTQAGKLIVR